MFKNYFKLAIKILGRRKFFTFISLFGISITLMILMLIASFIETELGNQQPLTNKDRMVFASHVTMKLYMQDTIKTVDSTLVNEQMQYDTTQDYQERVTSTSISPASYSLFNEYLREVEPVETYSFFSHRHSFDIFINANKLTFSAIYTDANYWKVFDFKFLEGQAFNQAQEEQQQPVLIIGDKAAKKYFGRTTGVVGEEITMGSYTYRVVGVVASPRSSRDFILADTYIPNTLLPPRMLESREFQGYHNGVFLAKNSGDVEKVQRDIERRIALINLPNPEEYNDIKLATTSFFGQYARGLLPFNEPEKSIFWAVTIFSLLILFFILLPTLNLININVSRMLERRSEIGIRKAFGADAGTILYQFIFENIIITFLGGIIGLVLALILLRVINQSAILPDTTLIFNHWVFIYSFIICLIFGIVSGLLPAWRMSKIQIADAIKSNQL